MPSLRRKLQHTTQKWRDMVKRRFHHEGDEPQDPKGSNKQQRTVAPTPAGMELRRLQITHPMTMTDLASGSGGAKHGPSSSAVTLPASWTPQASQFPNPGNTASPSSPSASAPMWKHQSCGFDKPSESDECHGSVGSAANPIGA
jgi:hypothetical protein